MNISFLRNAQAEEKEEMSYFCMHAPAADGHAAAQGPGAGSGAPAAAAPPAPSPPRSCGDPESFRGCSALHSTPLPKLGQHQHGA